MPPSPPSLLPSRQLDAAGRMLSPHPADGLTNAPAAALPPTGPLFHLLVVERDAAMRAMLTGMLADPYEVEAVGDNVEAGQAVERRRPDLAIVDLYLREPDGLNFVRTLRANPATADLPVVLLTASVEPVSRPEDRTSSLERTLFKPFGMRELLEIVRSTLALSTAVPNSRP